MALTAVTVFLWSGKLGLRSDPLKDSVAMQVTTPTNSRTDSKNQETSSQRTNGSNTDLPATDDPKDAELSSNLSNNSSPTRNTNGTPNELKDSGSPTLESSTSKVPISCRVYVNPIGSPANHSFRLIINSSSNFTANASIIWTQRTETITVDVVNGSASAIIKGDQFTQPKVSVSSQSDTTTELCTNKDS
ncbi:MAG: hypothetical protein F2595_03245 [Actinobacteria bacterium]|nr:hypothetical protein [Actinomycetota bacterium]MSZ96014.1 hypothetical protein [Actinomycetota bacterium]